MKLLRQARKFLGNIHNRTVSTQKHRVWTQDNVVNSPFNDVEIPNLTVPEYIWRNLDKWPDRTAVVCGITNRSYTYNQLKKYSENFAAHLRVHLNIKDGDVVAVMMPNALEYPIAVIGAMQAGAVVTTINPNYTKNEVYRQFQLAKPKLMIISPKIVDVVKQVVFMAKSKIPIVTVKNQNEDLPLETISFAELIYNDNIDKNVLKEVKRGPKDVALLPYSSGTTGLPKGVELTNRNKVANFAQQECNEVRHCEVTTNQYQDSVLAVLPFFHVYGLSITLLHKLVFGAKIVILPKFQPTTFLNALRIHKPALLYIAPPLALFLGSHPEVQKKHLDSVDRLVCAAAPISKSDIRRVLDKCQPNLNFFQIYGLTEVSPLATSMVPDSSHYTSVGYALPNSQLKVVDSNGQNVGPNEVGELHIRGPHVMKGYRDNPEATKAAITDDGWFKSGDMVSINSDGAVTIVDRIKELIKVKGYQVPPTELEDIMKEHPDILDAAVVGIPDVKNGEAPKAFIVLKEGRKVTDIEIRDFVNRRVAEFKHIKVVEFLDALPKNSTGKILRRVPT